jgi:hypothetical protein
MPATRREFLKFVGISLASLVTTRCLPSIDPTCYAPTPATSMPRTASPTSFPTVTCYMPTRPLPTPTFSSAFSARWIALRECWLSLNDARLNSPEDTKFEYTLRQRHADALMALVAQKELDDTVANEIGIAFDQAVAHIRRQLVTCYIALPPEFVPREDLMKQAAILTEMAQRSDIDPNTTTRARAAIERDMAWFAQFAPGKTPVKLDEVQATATEMEAAQILAELLLGKKK